MIRDATEPVSGFPEKGHTRKVTCFKSQKLFFLKFPQNSDGARWEPRVWGVMERKNGAGLVGALMIFRPEIRSMLSLWDAPFFVIFSGLVGVQDGVRSL